MSIKIVNQWVFRISSAIFLGGFLLWGGMQISFFSSYPTVPDEKFGMNHAITVKNKTVYVKPWMFEAYNGLWYSFIFSVVLMGISIVIARGNPLNDK